MTNLQELYDYYLETNPSTGKIRNATNFLIHVCQAMNVSSPEEVTDEVLVELPPAIDKYFNENRQKAVQDKGILAEMIGRYGPRNGWEEVYEILLKDKDENLRQFTLQALEFCALRQPQLAVPYINKFRKGRNKLMRQVAAILTVRMLCSPQKKNISKELEKWNLEGDQDFIKLICEILKRQTQNSFDKPEYKKLCTDVYEWMTKRFGFPKQP
ncbi:MAG: hypothetical protein GXO77_08860 [Calditrichaeota bacterium]|nr:hypothetical protein [Calditrichota bacterium]